MKNNYFFLLTVICLFFPSLKLKAQYTAPNILWSNVYGGTNNNKLKELIPMQNGGFAILREWLNTSVNKWYTNAEKYNADGTYSGLISSKKGLAGSLKQTSDGGFILAVKDSADNLVLTKFAPTNVIEWSKILGINNAYDIIQTTNGNYVVGGSNWIAKLDYLGNVVWQTYPFITVEHIIEASNGEYVFIGAVYPTGGNIPSGKFIKMSANGTFLLEKTLGSSDYDIGLDIKQTSDGGFIMLGNTTGNNGDVSGNHNTTASAADIWIVKLSNMGVIEWQKCFGGIGVEQNGEIQITSDGGYIFAGMSSSPLGGDITTAPVGADFWVVRIDNLGNILWQKMLNNGSFDNGGYIHQRADGSFLVGGNSDMQSTNVWILALAADPVAISPSNVAENFVVYPNPSADNLTIKCEHTTKVEVLNDLGQIVLTEDFNNVINPSINVEKLPTGNYQILIHSKEGKSQVVKWLKK